jgi:hypothetical protein
VYYRNVISRSLRESKRIKGGGPESRKAVTALKIQPPEENERKRRFGRSLKIYDLYIHPNFFVSK